MMMVLLDAASHPAVAQWRRPHIHFVQYKYNNKFFGVQYICIDSKKCTRSPAERERFTRFGFRQ